MSLMPVLSARTGEPPAGEGGAMSVMALATRALEGPGAPS